MDDAPKHGFVEPACVGLALEMGLDEHIASGEDSTSLDELVERTGVSSDIILRMLRVCTQRLYFE